jgi:hypothetical protein
MEARRAETAPVNLGGFGSRQPGRLVGDAVFINPGTHVEIAFVVT